MNTAERDVLAIWAASGAMALTGPPDRPLGPPAPLVPRMVELGRRFEERSATLGRRVELDPVALLGERAAIARLTRRGQVSVGGATRLLPTADGWVAVTLARPDDVDLLPAWLGLDLDADVRTRHDPWPAVSDAVRQRSSRDLDSQGALLGLPIGALPPGGREPVTSSVGTEPLPCRATRVGDAAPRIDLRDITVVDLSSLWSGPLCGSLLALAGAQVTKVESTTRPDGARNGPPEFFSLMNAGKSGATVDLPTPAGTDALRELIAHADVVIEGSRPRALAQLGIDATDTVQRDGLKVWVSITAHGRDGDGSNRVGFGDDAAVAGGLVAWHDDEPYFCADAVADPTTGLVAAVACLDALAVGGAWLLDVALANVAAHLAGPTLEPPGSLAVAPPRARLVSS